MIIRHDDGTVEFSYYRPTAQHVHLVGDFNRWQPGAELRRDERGFWRCQLALPAGEYRFKYLVDGTLWEADFAAYGVERDGHGDWNSVLWVGDEALVAPARAA